MKMLEAALLAASWGFDLRLGVQPSDTFVPVQRRHLFGNRTSTNAAIGGKAERY
jgi:hypothetical protein